MTKYLIFYKYALKVKIYLLNFIIFFFNFPVKLQMEPFDFDFKDVTPARRRRGAYFLLCCDLISPQKTKLCPCGFEKNENCITNFKTDNLFSVMLN